MSVAMLHMPNPSVNLAPFGRWTLRDEAAQRRLPQTFLTVRFSKSSITALGRLPPFESSFCDLLSRCFG